MTITVRCDENIYCPWVLCEETMEANADLIYKQFHKNIIDSVCVSQCLSSIVFTSLAVLVRCHIE